MSSSVAAFLSAVRERARAAALDPRFHPTQQDLLLRTLAQYDGPAEKNPLGSPLAVPYLVARAWGRAVDDSVIERCAAASLYLLALDLIDDVQDDDLAGKPHEAAGPAIAVNTGVTLLFLAFDRLRRAFPGEGGLGDHLELLNRVSLTAAAGQHRDLIGAAGASTPDEVLAMQEAKTSSLVLLAELGALVAGVPEDLRARYRAVGAELARLVQIVDDLRDIYGKRRSPDLAAGRVTYPVACFFERATPDERARFERLRSELPASLPALRRALYDAGAVARSAQALEAARARIHAEIAATGNRSAYHRTLLEVVDGLVSRVYLPRPVEASRALFQPAGPWHDEVARMASRFRARLAAFAPPPTPRLSPWHQPPWVYDAARRVIQYPDLGEQAGEVAPFQAELLGTDDLEAVTRLLVAQAPAVLAHELFHAWRDAAGRLGGDHWHEEWCANRLTVAYCREHEPAALERVRELVARVLSRQPAPEAAREAVARSREEGAAAGYGPGRGMDLRTMALAHLVMLEELLDAPLSLSDEIGRWLAPAAPERRSA